MSAGPDIVVFQLKSRVLRALYYERRTRKMVVQTTHGKFLIYSDIDPELTQALAAHAAPGMIFVQGLRAALKPRLAKISLENFLLLRRVRKLASETAPDDHSHRRPDAVG